MIDSLSEQLSELGVRTGGLLMVHSSFKSLGVSDPEAVVQALLSAIGPQGTLLMPALSYCQKPSNVHDTRTTPGCVGFLAEYFRTRPGTLRSLHPTHSVCGFGPAADAVLGGHAADRTPCGRNSPFRLVIELKGQIFMLGCGLGPNTTMHAIEELIEPPYLYGAEVEYRITDRSGSQSQVVYRTHGFEGFEQRYDRIDAVMAGEGLRFGAVGAADCYLVEADQLCRAATARLEEDNLYFVEKRPT